ncbi:MAG TPA: L,D-transpeptidase [Pseudolabrys sp.]|nr:L,D-transpeptidase [Pseudolabrys sp.]
MVDYVPLLARAVASLNPNTSEQRRVLYDRARKMLADKLRAGDPAVAQADLRAESAALEAAIQRVERETLRRTAPSRPTSPRETEEAPGYRDMAPLKDNRRLVRLAIGAFAAIFVLGGGVAAYSLWPRILSDVRSIPNPRSAPVIPEDPSDKTNYVSLRQLVYYRTNQPVGTIIVDKLQTFLYVVRPNVSAMRYRIGVGTECTALAGLYHVVRKEELPGGNQTNQQSGPRGARVIYLNDNRRIHGASALAGSGQLSEGCIRLVNDDLIYLYDRTPLENRVVVSN